jgi:hypothetical protein
MDGGHRTATSLATRPPSHFYARAYRALLEARYMLEDPERYYLARERNEDRSVFGYALLHRFVWDASGTAYEAAMKVSVALCVLPEFSPERVDNIYAACWKLNPVTGVRGNTALVEAAMAEVWHLCDQDAREEAGAGAIVPLFPER